MDSVENDEAGMREDWELLVSFLPANWQDLAAVAGALPCLPDLPSVSAAAGSGSNRTRRS